MSSKFYVGLDLTGFQNNGIQRPVSRVTLKVDEECVLTAGDDSGLELVADCPHATQAMVDAILSQVKGTEYQMYEASDINIDPSAELGDGITASGVYSVISRINDDGSGFPGVSAPGHAELEDEYPAGGPMTQMFNRKIGEIRSSITKTAEEIRLQVDDMESRVSSISTKIDSITLQVENGSTSSTIKLMANGLEIASQNISMNGLVTFTGLADGTTTIDGGCLKTGTIESMQINSSTIRGSTFYSETNTSSVSIRGGRMHLAHGDTDVGYIGSTYWENNPAQKGITFDLNPYGSYMAWATKASVDASSFAVKLLYAAEAMDISTLPGSDFYYVADRLYVECDGQFRRAAYFGGMPTKPTGRIFSATSGPLAIMATEGWAGVGIGTGNDYGIRVTEEEINLYSVSKKVVNCYNNLDMQNYSIQNTSDERLKTNIEPSDLDALGVIRSIGTYSFDWIEDGRHENLGFIAQQLEAEASHDFVSINEKDGHYSTKDLKMIPYLVKAVQQLAERLDALDGTGTVQRRAAPRKRWEPAAYTAEEKEAYTASLLPDASVSEPETLEPTLLPA